MRFSKSLLKGFIACSALCMTVVTSAEEYMEVQRFERLEELKGLEVRIFKRERVSLDKGKVELIEENVMIHPQSSSGLVELFVDSDPSISEIPFDNSILQEVPGVPDSPRYRDAKFDSVRRSFTADCRDAAAIHSSKVFQLLSSSSTGNESYSEQLALARDSLIGSTYEEKCLTPLQDTPVEIRRVIGVFSIGGQPLCSGTVVGAQTILTAKHCFFKPSSGIGTEMNAAWMAGNLTFHTSMKHGRNSEFTVAKPSTPQHRIEPFGAVEDQIVVKIAERFTHVATQSTAPVEMADYPIVGWIVGSNINLSDMDRQRTVIDYVRASKPEACALLERKPSGCLYHTCQTSKSTSGAGFFREAADGYELIATHKGTIAESGECEDSPPSDLQINLAVSL